MERTKVVIEFDGVKKEIECDGLFGVVYGEKEEGEVDIRQLLIGKFSVNTISYCLDGVINSFVSVMREEGVDDETIFKLVILSISNALTTN